ncbi:hypothetical protein BU25DRAFT_424467 [Macroventuria anomochaeta]|uniref:Uncharacterized protein n=1 Tax=Macroventuria anomochaeta TaxID=301207 RepID=A0ACB6RQS9_9PLEO|nr:uncharacterized protein BU25DRAFT_424467 [Macroventuria anomochaeta]KAF2624088.1 hypothetical protein BU25DRAFT_424467 [Macroventuria anomochaeta]
MPAVTDRIRSCCDQCAHSKIKCDSKRPICLNCRRRDRSCTYSYVRQSGRPRRIRPAQGDEIANHEALERVEEDGRPIKAGQYGASSTTAAPSSSPALAVDPALPNPAQTGLSMGIGNTLHHQTREDTFMSIEQSPPTVDQSAPLSSPSTDSSQLEQGLQNLLDDSKISSIVDGMMNLPLRDRRLSCVTESHDQCFHATAYDASDEDQLCRCPTILNKLYLIVMDPKLSQPTRVLPFDLILFIEQALQDAVEQIKHCKACGSSTLSSENGITLCVVANWIANSIQNALESEIDMSRKPSHSFWSSSERHTIEMGAMREQNHCNATKSNAVPPSLDVRNTLWIGMWRASSEAWKLLALIAKRMVRCLMAAGYYHISVRSGGDIATSAGARSRVSKQAYIIGILFKGRRIQSMEVNSG